VDTSRIVFFVDLMSWLQVIATVAVVVGLYMEYSTSHSERRLWGLRFEPAKVGPSLVMAGVLLEAAFASMINMGTAEYRREIGGRFFTKQSLSQFAHTIRADSGTRVSITLYGPDAETFGIGDQIAAALAEGGWHVVEFNRIEEGSTVIPGMKVHSISDPKAGACLSSALRAAGFAFRNVDVEVEGMEQMVDCFIDSSVGPGAVGLEVGPCPR
jgi:hypothetical protein